MSVSDAMIKPYSQSDLTESTEVVGRQIYITCTTLREVFFSPRGFQLEGLCLKGAWRVGARGGSPRICPVSGAGDPKASASNQSQGSPAQDPKAEIPNRRSQTESSKPKVPNQ